MRTDKTRSTASQGKAWRPSLIGALTGAILGGAGRAGLAVLHLKMVNRDTLLGILAIAVFGMIIGAAAGLSGRPVAGALLGAGLSAALYLVVYPLAVLFSFLGAVSMTAVWEVVVIGAVSGGLGGVAGRMAASRAS